MMKLVEESAGLGALERNGEKLRPIRYRISRYQGVQEGSGLPIPGLYRIEGTLDLEAGTNSREWIDTPLTLRLEDGRSLQITVVDEAGRVLSEGHGPMKCMCC
jgi:hypothetical protein